MAWVGTAAEDTAEDTAEDIIDFGKRLDAAVVASHHACMKKNFLVAESMEWTYVLIILGAVVTVLSTLAYFVA